MRSFFFFPVVVGGGGGRASDKVSVVVDDGDRDQLVDAKKIRWRKFGDRYEAEYGSLGNDGDVVIFVEFGITFIGFAIFLFIKPFVHCVLA